VASWQGGGKGRYCPLPKIAYRKIFFLSEKSMQNLGLEMYGKFRGKYKILSIHRSISYVGKVQLPVPIFLTDDAADYGLKYA